MDINFRRPAYHGVDVQLLAVQKIATPNIQTNEIQTAINESITVVIPKRIPEPIDFALNARLYRRKLLAERWTRRLSIVMYGLLALAVILAVVGFYVDHIYRGRALPYSYVGSVAIGGMSEAQVITALRQQESQLTIRFTDGGLATTIPVSKLGIEFNIQQLADQITHHSFNPFYYLSVHHFAASPNFTGNQLSQFLNQYVNNTKTAPENAVIIKTKSGLAIKPELQGFQANIDYLSKNILSKTADLSNSTISVNTVSTNPQIYRSDLAEQLSKGNTLLKNPVTIKYRNTVITPSLQDKLDWLQITQVPGTTSDSLTFTPALVRAYVLAQANKFQQHISSSSAQLPGQTVSTYQGTVINNIDDVTNQIVQAMNSSAPAVVTLTASQQTYNALTTASQ
jgi:hypothetical protein